MTDDPSVVGGRYELHERLGRGGMAEVRRAIDLRLDRPVAVKLLSPALAADPTFRERFRREAQSTARLNHPAIAAVYDSGEEPDPQTGLAMPYIVMELVEGTTLRDVLNEHRSLPPDRALELTRGVLQALAHSHAAGIVHRDIKPANVMLTPEGGVKVMDFGIARAATDTSEGLTQTAAVIGTAQYLSPEQARGESVDLRSDLYSTGCLLYELLVARPPFVGESSVSVAYQHVREPAAPPSTFDPAINAATDAVVLKALAKDPDDRYQSADEMAADLGRLLAHEPVEAAILTDPRPIPAVVLPAGAGAPTTVAPTAVAAAPVVAAPVVAAPADDPPRRTGRAALIAALVLVVLALVSVGLYRNFAGPEATEAVVSVPSTLDQTREQADATLRQVGLVPEFESVEGKSGKTVGTVVSQLPPGGTKVARDTVVTLRINAGPKSAKIPEGLVGDDVDEVEDVLAEAGFTNVKTTKTDDAPSSAAEGEVVSIDPDGGSTVGLDEQIEVTFASEKSQESTPPSATEPDDDPTTAESSSSDPTDEPEKSSEPSASAQPSSEPTASATTKTPKPDKTPKPTKAPKTPNANKPSKQPAAPSTPRP
ncbi:MAG TPA: Stk1 family PASTA domain-containing Ser/Thr kinase [Propionibacteriaceae bacterium]